MRPNLNLNVGKDMSLVNGCVSIKIELIICDLLMDLVNKLLSLLLPPLSRKLHTALQFHNY